MSAVHDDIAMQALAVQPERIKSQFTNYINEFKDSSWYPDVFSDRSISAEKKYAIDADADRFIYPLAPETELQKKLICVAEKNMLIQILVLRLPPRYI
jgi:hypothetical protein